jgi:LPS export ABC transporter protein LptC
LHFAIKGKAEFGEIMKLNKKTILISSILIACVVVVIIVAVIFKIKDTRTKDLLKALPEQIDLQIKGFVYTEVGEGDSQWEMKADTATYYRKKNLALFDRVQIKINMSDGKSFLLTADKGEMFTDTKDVKIIGNVVIASDTGDKFHTDYLNYNEEKRKFFTDAPVTMENKFMKIKGVGLTLFIKKGQLNLSSMVKAKIK